MKPLNEEQFEKILQELPKFERSAQAEAKFFKKLEALAAKKKLEGATEEEEVAPFGRINFLASLPAWPVGRPAWPVGRRLGLAGSFAAFIFIVGGTFAAYQPSITRGSLLYPWKQAAERVELTFAFTSLQKVDTHIQFSDRRLSEAENIVAKNPSLAWLVPKAAAHEEEIHLDSQEAIYLGETLADMRLEVMLASEIIEVKISVPEEAEAALEKIEKATERHVEVLTKIEEKGSKEVKEIVKRVAEEEDEHLAIVVEVKEKVKAAKVRKEAAVTVKFEKLEEREEKRADRKQEAREEFIEAVRVFQKFPEEQKKHLQEQLDRAKEAFEEGKFGRTKGLSRALQNQLKETPAEEKSEEESEKDRETSGRGPKVPDPGFKPPKSPQVPDPGFKPDPDATNEIENIYNDPKLSPPKPKDSREDELKNPDEFLMEIEEIKDSEGVFEKDHEIPETHTDRDRARIEKTFEGTPPGMDFKS